MTAKVYFTKEITPEGLLKVFDALNVELPGKVGVKVSTGEIFEGGSHWTVC